MRFKVLGPVQVLGDDGIVALSGRNLRTLLAALLTEPNRPMSTDRLMQAIWQDAPPRTAAKNLQALVYQLRRALGEHRVARHPHGYSIIVEDSELDAHEFESLAARGRSAVADQDVLGGRTLLARALGLWHGPAFADVNAIVSREAAARLTEERLRATEDRIDADLVLGHHDAICSELGALVLEHPLRERLRGQQMVALYRCGRQADALRAFQDARAVLADELGVEPAGSLQEIHLAILRGADPQPRAFLDARPVPAQLPRDIAQFTGREEQLARLDDLLEQLPGAVIVSAIAGLGGIGKTALAVHWAHRVADRFPDGQLHLNLHGYSSAAPVDPGHALASFLRALGVPPMDIPADAESAAAMYRTMMAGRRMLVLLDNAASADQVRPLIPSTPGCVAVITSRSRMGGLVAYDGAVRYDLDVLEASEAMALLGKLLGAARMAAEPTAAARLAEACGYLPLALRIAASQLAERPREMIADFVTALISDRLGLLDTVDDPRASVRVAFSHSYRALPAESQRLFRLLGLNPAHVFTTDAAAALAGLSHAEVEALLRRLVSASLIEQPQAGRYALHDLTRDYARAVAEKEESIADREAALRRLLDWYAATTAEAVRKVNPGIVRLPGAGPGMAPKEFGDWRSAMDWLDAERHNLSCLITHCAHRGPAPLSWMLVDALRLYYYIRSLLSEYQALAALALRSATAAGDPAGLAATHLALGMTGRLLGDLSASAHHFAAATEHAAHVPWDGGLALAQGNLAETALMLAQPKRALTHLRQAFDINARLGSTGGLISNHIIYSAILRALGRFSEAEQHDVEALVRCQELGADAWKAYAICSHGITLHRLGRSQEAIGQLDRARAMFGEAGAQHEAVCAGTLAEIYLDLGQYDEAETQIKAALDSAVGASDRTEGSATRRRQARLLRLTGRPEQAQEILDTLLRPGEATPIERILVLIELSHTQVELGLAAQAAASAAEANEVIDRNGILGLAALGHAAAARAAMQ